MTNSLFQNLGDKIIVNASSIAENALNLRSVDDVEYKIKLEVQNTEATKIASEFIKLVGEGLKAQNEKPLTNITDWGKKIGEIAIRNGEFLDETLSGTSFFRIAIWSFIEDQAKIKHYSVEQILTIAKMIDPLLDQAVHGFSLSYVENDKLASENFILSLQELSVPVVPIFDGIAILPLVGDIDTSRAKILLEQTMDRASELELSKLILDLSGVNFVDTMVANHIFQLADLLALLGVKTVITGISPAIAQTSVQLDIRFERITICSNLQQALLNIGYGLLPAEEKGDGQSE